MKKALVQNGQIFDIVNPGEEFEVHPSLVWMDAPDDVSPQTHTVIDGAIVEK
jgi:hypothetical protein